MATKLAQERSITFWKNLREMMQEIQAKGLEQDFVKDPGEMLRKHSLDVRLPSDDLDTEKPSGSRLSETLDAMGDDERRATLDALLTVSNMTFGSSIENVARRAIAVPVANVNAAANHNVVANSSSAANAVAVSNALATSNTTGSRFGPSDLVRPGLNAKVTLQPAAVADTLAAKFGELQLNEGRQKALLKKALLDDASIVAAQAADTGEVRKAVMAYKGHTFEVEGHVADAEIRVTSAKLIGT